jgi:hypothetical protein
VPGNGRIQEALMAAVSGAGRTKVEDDLLGGSHLSAVNEKEKKIKEKREEGVCGLARWLLGWSFPGRPSSCPFSFFFCLNSFPFYFLVCLITFSS